MCKAVLDNGFRCKNDVVENGFCGNQSCKMKGFNIVKEKMDAARAKGETFDAYAWNKNPYEVLIDKKPVAVAHAVKLHHAALVIDGLGRFSRRAFHCVLGVVLAFQDNSGRKWKGRGAKDGGIRVGVGPGDTDRKRKRSVKA